MQADAGKILCPHPPAPKVRSEDFEVPAGTYRIATRESMNLGYGSFCSKW